jgi:hypothetical protein
MIKEMPPVATNPSQQPPRFQNFLLWADFSFFLTFPFFLGFFFLLFYAFRLHRTPAKTVAVNFHAHILCLCPNGFEN